MVLWSLTVTLSCLQLSLFTFPFFLGTFLLSGALSFLVLWTLVFDFYHYYLSDIILRSLRFSGSGFPFPSCRTVIASIISYHFHPFLSCSFPCLAIVHTHT